MTLSSSWTPTLVRFARTWFRDLIRIGHTIAKL